MYANAQTRCAVGLKSRVGIPFSRKDAIVNNKFAYTALAAALSLTVADYGQAQLVQLAQSNISQNQSGSGNSQSISIGNVDGKQPAKKAKGKTKGKVSSTQKDAETGNTQSADVSGGGSGNVSQNQSGRNNSQSMNISGSASGKTPTVTQSQTGANRKQSITVDGKKVDTDSK